MELSACFSLAWRTLHRNRLRSCLTLLGITIGVGAVLAMVAVGNGARASIEDQVAAAGMNIITVTAGNYRMKGEDDGGGVADHASFAGPEINRPGFGAPRPPGEGMSADSIVLKSAVWHPGDDQFAFRLIGHPEDDP